MRRSSSSFVKTLFVVASVLLAIARTAAADEESELEKARNAYLAHEYEEADARFRALFDPKSGVLHDSDLVADARMYWAAVLVALQKEGDASQLMEKLLEDKPEYQPDPLRVPAEIVNFFIDIRARVRERLANERASRVQSEAQKRIKAAERTALLERLAGEQLVTTPHSRFIALLPFGVGQFQNRQMSAGYTVLSIEALLAIASGVTVPVYLYNLQQSSLSQRQGRTAAAQAYLDRAVLAREVNLAVDGALAVAAVAGVIHAELTFVPSVVETRRRVIPSATLVPTVLPDMKGGLGVGLSLAGTF